MESLGRMIRLGKPIGPLLGLLPVSGLLMLVFWIQFSLTSPVDASHGCGNDDYLHVHWERSSNPRTNDYCHSIFLWEDQGIDYATIVDNAAGDWNTNQDYIEFDKITSGTPDHYVFIKDDPNDSAWGSTSSNPSICSSSSTHLSFADVTLNSDAIEYSIDVVGRPTTLRWKVAEHEFGHSIGLAHPSVSTSTPAVMHQGWNGYFYARTRDITVLGWSQLYGHTD